jgi:hypothetical protein
MGLEAFAKLLRTGCGDAVPAHEILGENLRGLEPGSFRPRPKNSQPGELKSVHDSGGQRVVRPHHGEPDAFPRGEIDQSWNIPRAEREVFAELGAPGIARCAIEFFHTRGLPQFPR